MAQFPLPEEVEYQFVERRRRVVVAHDYLVRMLGFEGDGRERKGGIYGFVWIARGHAYPRSLCRHLATQSGVDQNERDIAAHALAVKSKITVVT